MPHAIDTNVLVRALVEDGTEQTRRSRECINSGRVFIGSSVLLETEWVLRSHLKLARTSINALFAHLAGLEQVELQDRPMALRAIAAHAEGMDFADAIHLFSSSHCNALYSFDEGFRRSAKKMDGAIEVLAP